jgi:hypothetical protein
MSRCKPGDLAIIVRAIHPQNNGLLVTILPDWRKGREGLEWLTASTRKVPGVMDNGEPAPLRYIGWCADVRMRPIRDPGPAARDETLEWKPVPKLGEVEELGLAVQHLKAIDRFVRRLP